MKTNLKKILAAVAILIAGTCYTSQAQKDYKTAGGGSNSMKMSGTSTFHNWTMSSQVFTGQAQFVFSESKSTQLASVKSLSFILPVEDLKGSEKGLDKNAYEALKSDQNKNITYKLITAQVMPGKSNKYMVKARGNLTIAGVSKEIIMDVYCTVNKDASIVCAGSYKLKMTDYHVKPPKFMMGAMTTGDDITLDFAAVYK